MKAMLAAIESDNLTVAKALAKQGFYVFPCQESGHGLKRPCHHVYWRHQSTQDIRRLEDWWTKWPGALPAIDLDKSGLIVIDADRHGGPDGVAAWEELTVGLAIDTLHVETPRDGLHYYFRQPEGERLGNREGLIKGRGINVRGSGGYVIAPGAMMPDGREYRRHGRLADIAPLPGRLADLLRSNVTELQPVERPTVAIARRDNAPPQAYLDKAIGEELDRLASAPKGASNNTLNEVAFALGTIAGAGWISRGQAQGWIEQTAWSNDAIRRDGRSQMLATIRSGLESGMKSPRPMPEEREFNIDDPEGAQIAQALLSNALPVTETAETAIQGPDGPEEFPDYLTHPGGLVGEMVDWIEATARYPSRAMGLAAALSVLGTAMGREWSGPTESSTTLYTLILAPTGGGKDHALEQAARLMTRSGMVDIIGPDDFQSANAMASMVQRKPLSLCLMDEFGAFLARITHKHANSFARDTSAFLRKMWSIKFKQWRSSEYAQRQSVSVWAPAFNVLGVSVPKEFYAALRGADIANGFFNRFFVVSVAIKPVEREPLKPPAEVPQEITRKLTYAMTRGRLSDWKRDGLAEVIPQKVVWGEGGEAEDAALKDEIELRIEADEDGRDFYTRTREMAIRLATIVGFGRDMLRPHVDAETMRWAGQVALWSTEQMLAQFREWAAETEAQALAKEIVRHVRAVCKTDKRIAHSHLLKRLDYKYRAGDVKGAIEQLVAGGDLKMEQGEARGQGRKPLYYRL